MITCWIPVSPDPAGNYLATPGNRYAALISVDARAPISTLIDALKTQGFDVTYSWQSGQAVRAQFLVDRWIASLPAPADGKVWMYFEMNYTSDTPKSLASHIQRCVLFICGSADISNVFEARQVPDDTHPCGPGDPQGTPLPPPSPGCPAEPFPLGATIAGGVFGLFLGWAIGRLT